MNIYWVEGGGKIPERRKAWFLGDQQIGCDENRAYVLPEFRLEREVGARTGRSLLYCG